MIMQVHDELVLEVAGGEVVVQSAGSGVVDVSIIVGRDVARP